jgi:hypothetical protein
VTLKRTALLILIVTLAAAITYAQTDDETTAGEDSLQTVEDDQILEAESEDSSAQVQDEDIQVEVQIPSQPTAVVEAFFQALKDGDSLMVSNLISEEGLENVNVMLEILKENLDDDPDAVMSRLASAGYTATANQVKDWSPMDYLTHTVVLPIMKARYAMYEMEIDDFPVNGDRLQVPITFINAAGVQMPFQAELVKERDDWRVSTFMGLNSFP